ncbi:hypothetical protein HRD68_16575 [Yersinia massiliensis]|uniref:hypothetical protein n=1 Tax=Yersinia massiliensis TaxID=419257 RepID=UPI0011A661E8|nr:hypothetical protein [Yersinia massiliensis]QKJ12202.1 hypothetical protein HRD68_16575 [Yersinia massiliensis]
MKRESRYLVVKRADIFEHLTDSERVTLECLLSKINSARFAKGKIVDPQYVVVGSDWPEYETVWGMIESRVDGISATVKQIKPISFDELADSVKHVTGGIRMEFDPKFDKGHQAVPFMNFNSLSRIVEIYRAVGYPVEGGE